MRIILYISVFAFLTASCGENKPHTFTSNEKAVLDSLRHQLGCGISVDYSRDLLRFDKPYDFNISLSNVYVSHDSLGTLAKYIEHAYYPHLNEKDRYQNMVIRIESRNKANMSIGKVLCYTFSLDN